MANVLLVEPDYILANIYAEALSHDGHKVQQAADAQTAIDAADKSTPDVVVLELQLAEHNGIEFLYEFRSYNEWRSVPVVIHSTIPPGEMELARSVWPQLGIVDYCYKPSSTLKVLLKSVDKAVAQTA